MKKTFYLPLIAVCAAGLAACSDDDNGPKGPELEQNYFSIEGATYQDAEFPVSTSSNTLEGVDMSNQVMNGATNYVTVTTEQDIDVFYVGIAGVPGYYEYNAVTDESLQGSYRSYVIPLMISEAYTGTQTLKLSGKLADGDVLSPITERLTLIETQTGALEVKMAFSNDKDVDLHVLTPSGHHIYYGNRGGYITVDGQAQYFGLDIDSNAGCTIDGVNKENIVIPQQLVENGEYQVVINMFSNCQPSLPTSWSIVTRYKGALVTPITGKNPASGVYEAYASDDDFTKVMTFRITGANNNVVWPDEEDESFRPATISKAEIWKIQQHNMELSDF